MRTFLWFVTIFATLLHTQSDVAFADEAVDKIRAEIAEAEANFAAEMDKARESLISVIVRKQESAKKMGDVAAFEKAANELVVRQLWIAELGRFVG